MLIEQIADTIELGRSGRICSSSGAMILRGRSIYQHFVPTELKRGVSQLCCKSGQKRDQPIRIQIIKRNVEQRLQFVKAHSVQKNRLVGFDRMLWDDHKIADD